MIKKLAAILVAIALVSSGGALAAGSSASYKITSEIIDAGAASGSSTSYRLLGKAREREILSPGGFLRGAYIRAAALAPLVTGITPSIGLNTGPIDITDLAGTNFAAGASVKLSKSGQPDINATNVTVVSSSKITCTFDLTGAAAGLWDVTVTNTDGRSGTLPSAFTIAFPAPTIATITPNSGINNATVSITNLAGTGFRAGAVGLLIKSGESDIIAENVAVESSTKITCQFNLAGKTVGLWDVKIINPDAKTAVLPQGFKIEAPTVEIIKPVESSKNPFNPSTGATAIKFTLSKDAEVYVYVYNIRGERIWEYRAPAGSPGGTAGTNEILWDGVTAFKQVVGSGVYLVHVVAKVNGEVKILSKTKIAIIK